jgi:hypothetical protein
MIESDGKKKYHFYHERESESKMEEWEEIDRSYRNILLVKTSSSPAIMNKSRGNCNFHYHHHHHHHHHEREEN